MTSLETLAKRAGDQAQPAWEVALLFPEQGDWTDSEYVRLTNQTNRLVELVDGRVEVLPMPTDKHQRIVAYLYDIFLAFARHIGGKVLFAPLRVRIRTGRYREPDLVLLLSARDRRRQEQYWEGADLVVEVVSPDDPERDLVDKRMDYAEVGIPEYWIVNPLNETITVLRLAEGGYVQQGVFGRGEVATSVLLEGLEVGVDAAFDAD